MAVRQMAALAFLILCIASGAQGKRSLLQGQPPLTDLLGGAYAPSNENLSQVANSLGLNQPPTTSPPTPLVLPPPTVQPPTTQPPAFQPPNVQPPQANVVQPPAPAAVPPQAQAPAPTAVDPAVIASVPVPAPAPAPVAQPPQCGQMPQCRVFVEDMVCCKDTGILTNKQHAVLRLQCTHPVNYYPKCFKVGGPSNYTAFNQFETAVWSTNHVAQVNLLNQYKGNVTVDIEQNRVDQNLAADCGLFVTPCLYQGQLIKQVAPVSGTSFNTISTDDFLDVTQDLEVDLDDLDSLVYPNPQDPFSCQQVNLGNVNGTFYNTTWVNFNAGQVNTCNATTLAAVLAAAPAPSPVENFIPPVNVQASG